MIINGDYTQFDFGKLVIELGGDTQGIGYDWLNVNGEAKLDGLLDIYLYGGFNPSIGQTFSFLTATSGISGEFDSHEFENGPSSYWDISYGTNSVNLEYLGTGNPVPDVALHAS